MHVGTPRADEFGELRMSHGKDVEQEAPVENIRLFFQRGAQLRHAPVDFLHQNCLSVPICHTCTQSFEHRELLPAGVVRMIARHFRGK